MLLGAAKITDENKKNELILYAQSINCKAVFSTKFKGMAIECKTIGQAQKIKEKIQELI